MRPVPYVDASIMPPLQGVGQIGVGGANMAAGQQGMMRRPSEALSQPALEPLLAAFSAQMGVGQVIQSGLLLHRGGCHDVAVCVARL